MRHFPMLVIALLAACGRPPSPPQEKAAAYQTMQAEAGKFRISGPYVHDNLAVYLIHSTDRDERDFGTLDEGLKDGTVSISEKEQEQVSELLLENKGDKPVFIQEGDRVKGGKQDRIVGLSFVVPPKSGKIGIPSFCIEQGRWAHKGADPVGFTDVINRPLASKEIREAAKVQKDQSAVWRGVARGIRKGEEQLDITNRTTNLNETLDSKKVVEAVEPFRKVLAALAERNPDAVGVAFALNGIVEEINVYPGHKLLAKLYQRLLESYALEAAFEKKGAQPPSASVVAAFMKEGRERGRRSEEAVGNRVTLCDYEKQVRCQTEFEGQVVHAQWMRRSEGAPITDIDEPAPQRQQVEQRNDAPRR